MTDKIFRLAILIVLLGNGALQAQMVYPYEFRFEGNPLVRMHGAADPDAHVWNDTVWLYCSQDRNPYPGRTGYGSMDGYHVFSSPDMIHWTDHGEILHSKDLNWGTDGYMWAPCAAKKNGKYYLYYPHKDKNMNWRIGVAIADKPQGPFEDIGHPISGIGGTDPSVFIDDDGEAYIYAGGAQVAKLKPNMIELAESTRKLNYAPQSVLNDDKRRFHEGAFMHKKDGIYYFSYTNFKNSSHQAYYAMGNSPYGPFVWKGPMAPNPSGAQDHHSVIEFKGQSFYFYHITTSDFPIYKEGQGRIACFDRLFYNEDGSIEIVSHTRQKVIYDPIQNPFNNRRWSFPGDTVAAWQYDYFTQNNFFFGTRGDTLFALDSAQTIGVYGCNDASGKNLRNYSDAGEHKDAAQYNWDQDAETFQKHGQWLKFSSSFTLDESYQLMLRARANSNAGFRLTIAKLFGDTVFVKDLKLKDDFTFAGKGNTHTDWMVSDFVLDNLWGSYLVTFDWYDHIGEPGIFGAFTFRSVKNNLDLDPPEWLYVSIGDINLGTEIIVMTNEDAKVYMVPGDTPADAQEITDSAIKMIEVNANQTAAIPTTEMNAGNYVLYALDSVNNISPASRSINLQTLSQLRHSRDKFEIQIHYQGLNKEVIINSNTEIEELIIYDLAGRKVKSLQCATKIERIPFEEQLPGVYILYAKNQAGTTFRLKFIKP